VELAFSRSKLGVSSSVGLESPPQLLVCVEALVLLALALLR